MGFLRFIQRESMACDVSMKKIYNLWARWQMQFDPEKCTLIRTGTHPRLKRETSYSLHGPIQKQKTVAEPGRDNELRGRSRISGKRVRMYKGVLGGGSHLFYTSIHFVKNAHVVKLYVTFVRILHIDKIPPKFATFCIRFQFFTCMALFYNWRGSNIKTFLKPLIKVKK